MARRKETREAAILRLTTQAARPASEIARLLGFRGRDVKYATQTVIALAEAGKLARSWDTEGMCYYTAV